MNDILISRTKSSRCHTIY